MTIKDLTIEQVEKVVALAHYPTTWPTDAKYVDEALDNSIDPEDAQRLWVIHFEQLPKRQRAFSYTMLIRSNLNIELICHITGYDESSCVVQRINNQHQIQKNFIEWGIEPS